MADKKLTSVSQVGLQDATYIFAETTDGIHKVSSDEFGGFSGIELTQAEYDALPEEEKNNGLYFITDGVYEEKNVKKFEIKRMAFSGTTDSGGYLILPLTSEQVPYAVVCQTSNHSPMLFYSSSASLWYARFLKAGTSVAFDNNTSVNGYVYYFD